MAEDMKVTPAPRQTVDVYLDEVEQLLSCLGHPEAYVTDWSSLADFDADRGDAVEMVSQAFGVPLPPEAFQWTFAELLPVLARTRH